MSTVRNTAYSYSSPSARISAVFEYSNAAASADPAKARGTPVPALAVDSGLREAALRYANVPTPHAGRPAGQGISRMKRESGVDTAQGRHAGAADAEKVPGAHVECLEPEDPTQGPATLVMRTGPAAKATPA